MEKKEPAMLVAAAFFALLFAMSFVSFIKPETSFSDHENRFLTKRPVLTRKSILDGSFAFQYETYLADQFPYRNQWITLKTAAEKLLLKTECNGVYFGRNGYFIETHREEEIDFNQLEKNTKRLVSFVKKQKEKSEDIQIKLLLAPTANVILTKQLPKFSYGFDQESYLSNLKNTLCQEGLNDVLVDVTEALMDHQEEYIFYRTDHHWTTLGAYYAYREWAKSINITPIPLENYEKRLASEDFSGTVSSKVNWLVKPDSIYLFVPKEKRNYQVEYNFGERTDNDFYDYNQLEKKDKYAVFFGGNQPVATIKTEVKNGKRMLVIKDSYAHCFVPFLVEHYEEVIMIDLRYFNIPIANFIDNLGVNDVLFLYNIPNFVNDRNLTNLR